MKELFLENIAAAKERLRSTLAIPSQDAGPFGYGVSSTPVSTPKAPLPYSMGGTPLSAQPLSKKSEINIEVSKSKPAVFVGHSIKNPNQRRQQAYAAGIARSAPTSNVTIRVMMYVHSC